MSSFKWFIAAAILLSGTSIAEAQTAPSLATVVATCGTPPSTYTAGQVRPMTQNTSGQNCDANAVSGGTITTITNPVGVKGADGSTISSTSNPVPTKEVAATAVSTAALAANLVISASAANLVSFQVSADSTLSAAAWWVMIYNATSAPADGAVTPAKCYAMPSGSTSLSAGFTTPVSFGTGIVIGVSTAGCFTKTASTHAFISGDAR